MKDVLPQCLAAVCLAEDPQRLGWAEMLHYEATAHGQHQSCVLLVLRPCRHLSAAAAAAAAY